MIVTFGTGIFSMTLQGFNFAVDIHLFLLIAMLLALRGLAKSFIQIIGINEKTELALA